MNTIFILKTICLKKKTEKDLKKEYEVYKVKYSNADKQIKMNYEEYIKFLKGWNKFDYHYLEEDNCYFVDIETAEEYAKENIGDLNDGGVYNYIAIVEIPLDTTYAMTEVQSIEMFKFNNKTDCYDYIDDYFNEEIQYIKKRVLGKL